MQCRCELSSPHLTPLLYSLFHRFTQNRCSLLCRSTEKERQQLSREMAEKKKDEAHETQHKNQFFGGRLELFERSFRLLFSSSYHLVGVDEKLFRFARCQTIWVEQATWQESRGVAKEEGKLTRRERKKENWGIFETRADSSVAHICSLCKLHCGGRAGKEAIKSQRKRPKIKTLDIELNYKLRLTTGFFWALCRSLFLFFGHFSVQLLLVSCFSYYI